ncbi:MAG TPA: hypothetical protein VGZ23_18220 [bacterium]|nr:hypothetical protein [bacterium]
MTSPLKVKKGALPVVIYTATHRIEGLYHSFDSGVRLLDDLNARETAFIPLTDARITKLEGDAGLIVAGFVAVNLHSITLFFPNPKAVPTRKQESLSERRFMESTTVPGLVIGPP